MENPLAPLLPEGALRVRRRDRVLVLDARLLGNSQVLRKLVAEDEVLLQDDFLFEACECVALLPRSLPQLRAWLRAMDLLCADPGPELCLHAALTVFKSELASAHALPALLKSVDANFVSLDQRIMSRT
jgi:hypothetical protein